MRGGGVVSSGGYTLVELVLAMAVFSFMLLIVVSGFMNIVHIHNQAVASNAAQDSARTALDELVRGVRNSGGVVAITPGINGSVCLTGMDGMSGQKYEIQNAGGARTLVRYDVNGTCAALAPPNTQAITSSNVNVTDLTVTQLTNVAKPEYQISITVASNNGTTSGSGSSTVCNNSNADRNFCSVVTLTSGAVAR